MFMAHLNLLPEKKTEVVFQTGWDLHWHHHWATFCPMESPAAPENLLIVTWGAFQMDKNPSSKKSNLQLGYVGQGNTKTVTKVQPFSDPSLDGGFNPIEKY